MPPGWLTALAVPRTALHVLWDAAELPGRGVLAQIRHEPVRRCPCRPAI